MKTYGRSSGILRRTVLTAVALAIVSGAVESPAAPEGEPSIKYKASLEGVWYGDLRDAVTAQSLMMSPGAYTPATMSQLDMSASADAAGMGSALHAAGYLDAEVTSYVCTNSSPVRILFRAVKGPLFKISTFDVAYSNATGNVPKPPSGLLVKSGSAAAAESIEKAEALLLRFLKERGYPHPKMAGRTVARDNTNKTVAVVCAIDPGVKAVLGKAAVKGCVRVNPAYILNRVRWLPGDKYNIKVLEDLEKKLLQSGLFSVARVSAGTEDAASQLPVLVSVTERPFRTVRAGVSYYTDEGLGGQASFENRSLFDNAESLSLTIFGSEIEYGARAGFIRPDLVARDIDLSLDLESSRESPDAYDSTKTRFAVTLGENDEVKLRFSVGAACEVDRVKQQDQLEEYDLISLPLTGEWDHRNNQMDPTRGNAVMLSLTPYKDVLSDTAFLKSEGEGNLYVRLARSPQTVLAMRAMLGSISDYAGESIPADKQFYAGGGGSIRGYKYQSVGELENGEPVGGNSMAAVSAELRTRISPTMGTVLFVDGGTAYPGSTPDTDIPFLWGAGAGVRYYLGDIPLRFDIAVPLDRREDIDEPYQFYFSLGQAF